MNKNLKRTSFSIKKEYVIETVKDGKKISRKVYLFLDPEYKECEVYVELLGKYKDYCFHVEEVIDENGNVDLPAAVGAAVEFEINAFFDEETALEKVLSLKCDI